MLARRLETALKICWVEINPSQGGAWLVMARIWRSLPKILKLLFIFLFGRIVQWQIGRQLHPQAAQFWFEQLQMVGGLHHGPYMIESLAAFHRDPSWSKSPTVFIINQHLNRAVVDSLLNNLVKPLVTLRPSPSNLLKSSTFDRLLGIFPIDCPPGDLALRLKEGISKGVSMSIEEGMDFGFLNSLLAERRYRLVRVACGTDSGRSGPRQLVFQEVSFSA
jgi:hypothetical protein